VERRTKQHGHLSENRCHKHGYHDKLGKIANLVTEGWAKI
jgi:hypothetical protein